MARINIHTLRFLLSVSFITIVGLALVLVISSISKLSGVLHQGRYIMQVSQPTQTWTEKLRANVLDASNNLEYYVMTQDTAYRDVALMLWDREIEEATGMISSFEDGWEYAEYGIAWLEVKYKLEKLAALHNTIASSTDASAQRNLFQGQAIGQLQSVNKQLLSFFETVRLHSSEAGDALIASINRFFYQEGGMFIIMLVVTIFLFRIILRRFRLMLQGIQSPVEVLSQGNLPEIDEIKADETKELLEEIKIMTQSLRSVKDFALDVGKGNFDNALSVFDGKGEIGSSLAEMRDSLQKVDEQDKQRDWINSGFNKYGELIRRIGDNLNELTEEMIKSLVEFLEVNQGGFFVVEDSKEEDSTEMVLRSTYAYDRQKFEERRVKLGEGLLGQAWQEKEIVVLNKVPNDYLYITSGLGYSTPSHLVLVPLIANNEVYGMFELASFSPLKSFQLEFLKGLGESVAAAINTVKVNDNTRRLLDESQELTEQMRSQEEEMRQNMEELQATQEEMKRGADDAEAKVYRLNSILNSTADPVITVTTNGIIDAFNYAAEALFGFNSNEVIDHNIGMLLPEEKVMRREMIETSNSPVERSKVITRRHIEGIRKGGRRFMAEVAIKDAFYHGEKYFTLLIRDVSVELDHVNTLEQSNKKLELELQLAQKEQSRADRAEHEMRLRHLALDRSVLLIDLKNDGSIQFANELLTDALGYEEKELNDKSFRELLVSLDNASAFDYFWKAVIKSKEVVQQDLQLKGKEDERVWARCAFSKVLDDEGNILKVMLIAQDISTQMQLLNQTRQEFTRLQAAQSDIATEGMDEASREKLAELKTIQEEIQESLRAIMHRNDTRMRDAIALKEQGWKG